MSGIVSSICSIAYDLWNWYYSGPKFSDQERQIIRDKWQGCCYVPNCGKHITDDESIYINIQNNNYKLENMVIICKDCDNKRQNKPLIDFMDGKIRCRGYRADVLCKNLVSNEMPICYKCAAEQNLDRKDD